MPTNSAVSTGLSELDELIHSLWIGDNVVFQVDRLSDYQQFVEPFAAWVRRSGRRLVYFRFAKHAPLLEDDGVVEVHELDPTAGFEVFLGRIYEGIKNAGRGACYVFDSLSELAADWFSDAMLGNFFRLTCPYLYDMETIAYFALLRNLHSSHATTPIRETTQLLLDVYHHQERIFLRPVKVQMRHSHSLFTLHEWKDAQFQPVRDSCTISEILNPSRRSPMEAALGRMDIWHRTFLYAERALRESGASGQDPAADRESLQHLLRMIVSRDERMQALAEAYFSVDDVLDIARRTIGTGLVGGKTVGMLLSRAILCKENPRWRELLEPHDSFYIASDVFFSYLVRNGCWWFRHEQRGTDEFLQGAQEARRRIITGSFPPDVEAQFAEMLDHFGKSPLIVRSSSLLEDNFGNSFAGKYESVFCGNQGSAQQRLDDFIAAIKTVYASSISEDALGYRARHGLLNQDEQMALLVQRVSGFQEGTLFYPQMAGVGFSHNLYAWSEDIDPEAGIVRLVFGLGTRAVDRMDDDYTRLIALNAPKRIPDAIEEGVPANTQRYVDVIDLHQNQLTTKSFEDIVASGPSGPMSLFASRSERASREARQYGRPAASLPLRLTFKGLLSQTSFAEDVREMLQILEKAYTCPVDVEFTANTTDASTFRINLVQCRPLQMRSSTFAGELAEDVPLAQKVLETRGPVIGRGRIERVGRIIYVVPAAYAALPLREKYAVARLIGKVVHAKEETAPGPIMLLGPGRWGTTTPTLGVTVKFSEIERVTFLGEIVEMGEHPVPEVSLGTHFFSEMVEMDMFYMVLIPGEKGTFLNRTLLEEAPNRLTELLPGSDSLERVVRVIDAPALAAEAAVVVHANTVAQRVACYIDKKPAGVPTP